MSATSSALPPGWEQLLLEVELRLKLSLAATEERIGKIAVLEDNPLAQSRQQDMARLEVCLQGLGTQLESAEKLVQEVDLVLQESESALSQRKASCESVRQSLADWAGRAIG